MTTEVTTTVQPTTTEPVQPEASLVVEAVTTAADANATAEAALETVRETEAEIVELENNQDEIAAEIQRVEQWQSTMQAEMSRTTGTVELLTAAVESQSQTLAAILARLTPPQESPSSEVAADPVSQTVETEHQEPSEPHDQPEHRKRHQWI
jgi:septation ring formation regulator EzrA